MFSPIAVTVRYLLMALAGIGFILIRKWGAIVYLVTLTINWVSYYTLYEGQGIIGPFWLVIPLFCSGRRYRRGHDSYASDTTLLRQ